VRKCATEAALDFFVQAYRAKYDKAVACLARDRDRLLAFYDVPALGMLFHQSFKTLGSGALLLFW
jgi:transposase-like protein